MGWFAALMGLTVAAALMCRWRSARPSGKRTPAAPHAVAQSAGEALREAFGERAFWLLTLGYFVCGFQVVFIGAHLPSYVIDKGLTANTGMLALALIGLFNIFGTYGFGLAGGRWSKKKLLAAIYFARSIIIVLFLLAPLSHLSVAVFAAAMGLLWLGTVPLTNGLVAQIFGVKYLAMLSGFVFFSHQLGSFLGVWLGGFIFDRTGAYDIVWMISIALGVLAALVNLPVDERPLARLSTATHDEGRTTRPHRRRRGARLLRRRLGLQGLPQAGGRHRLRQPALLLQLTMIPETLPGPHDRAPVIAAPMFLVSGPHLVIEACKAGVAGTFPTLNARPIEVLDEWLTQINAELGAAMAANPSAAIAPYGVNLILHHSNTRLAQDFELVVKHKVPFVITSLGHPGEVVKAVHAYGGVVFSDVIHAYHAKKAIAAGVDGIVCVAAGAGGHAGTQSPFSLVREIREFWDGALVLGGAISDGASVRAAEVMGADFAYLGTRFIATRESMATDDYKQMLLDCSGEGHRLHAGHHRHPCQLPLAEPGAGRLQKEMLGSTDAKEDFGSGAKAWRDTWSAGHGVATIHDVPTTAELVARLAAEYRAACAAGQSGARLEPVFERSCWEISSGFDGPRSPKMRRRMPPAMARQSGNSVAT
jgi:nitronate monooxygenase